jgi:hypothetical protein
MLYRDKKVVGVAFSAAGPLTSRCRHADSQVYTGCEQVHGAVVALTQVLRLPPEACAS